MSYDELYRDGLVGLADIDPNDPVIASGELLVKRDNDEVATWDQSNVSLAELDDALNDQMPSLVEAVDPGRYDVQLYLNLDLDLDSVVDERLSVTYWDITVDEDGRFVDPYFEDGFFGADGHDVVDISFTSYYDRPGGSYAETVNVSSIDDEDPRTNAPETYDFDSVTGMVDTFREDMFDFLVDYEVDFGDEQTLEATNLEAEVEDASGAVGEVRLYTTENSIWAETLSYEPGYPYVSITYWMHEDAAERAIANSGNTDPDQPAESDTASAADSGSDDTDDDDGGLFGMLAMAGIAGVLLMLMV